MEIDISNFLMEKESVINGLFSERIQEVGKIGELENQYAEEIDRMKVKFDMALENIPKPFKKTKETIEQVFLEYDKKVREKNVHINEESYKKGLIDGIKLIFEAIEKG